MPNRLLPIALLGALCASTIEARGAASDAELRSCWLTQYAYLGRSENDLRAIAQNIKSGGMNTVYLAMYAGASTLWPSTAYAAVGGTWTSSTVDYAALLTRVFHEEGLAVGAWFEYGLALGPASHPIALQHPDWLARDQQGDPVTGENGGFVFLSPGSPGATQLIVDMARELADNYDFDDIQLDRIRWGRKTSGREYGYEDSTASLYFAQYGVQPPNNVNQPQWVAFREGLVNDVFERCYDAVKAVNPEIVVSAAPTGSYGITQHMQRWSSWLEGGYVDLVMPQMYMLSLGAFENELAFQLNQAGAFVERLGVGYRASDDNDHPLVLSQLQHARSLGVPHGALWVYHYYSTQVAIQDQIDNLALPGAPWNSEAENPFVSPRGVQVVVDNADGPGSYSETGAGWIESAQPDFFRFDSRVADGGALLAATFSAPIPKTGSYDVFAWYTASSNRNDEARYTLLHYGGFDQVTLDQRTGGGRWVALGRHVFIEGTSVPRVAVSNDAAAPGEFTSADAVKLRHVPFAENVCIATPNSSGAPARIGVRGSANIAANDLVLTGTRGVPNQFGVFFYAPEPIQVPFGDGFLCAGGQSYRLNPPVLGDPSGNYERALDLTVPPASSGPGAIASGSTWRFQLWYRDPAGGGAGFNLSDALEVTFEQ